MTLGVEMTAMTQPMAGEGHWAHSEPAQIVSIDAARRRLRGADPQSAGPLEAAPTPATAARVVSPPALATFTRLLVWVLSAVAAFALALGVGLALRPAAYSGSTWVHSVTAGESVWGLAASLELSRPLEDVVEDIRSLNGLTTSALTPGQELLLPAQ